MNVRHFQGHGFLDQSFAFGEVTISCIKNKGDGHAVPKSGQGKADNGLQRWLGPLESECADGEQENHSENGSDACMEGNHDPHRQRRATAIAKDRDVAKRDVGNDRTSTRPRRKEPDRHRRDVRRADTETTAGDRCKHDDQSRAGYGRLPRDRPTPTDAFTQGEVVLLGRSGGHQSLRTRDDPMSS